MPQLDKLIYSNQMVYIIIGFTIFYILFSRKVISVLAYILKFRNKLFNLETVSYSLYYKYLWKKFYFNFGNLVFMKEFYPVYVWRRANGKINILNFFKK